jgi:ABC-type multidrug transport system ATPase subunit
MPDETTKPQSGIAVQASTLTRKFGSLTAVDQVTLTIGQGEIFGLIGPNGAGKSTSSRC